ncbi:glycogen synthase GlgA [Paenibacillus provencensis]|uniref:Glycogen synthase n=1 Tax=Paenibacillus provencensis TaxID=441151 RepID=A0ABW3PSP8_9BACL|nr:glycogen synthase GlgA [Paenibacillus sp. MER 78]MCM3126727.1 glycogen synthase GlgA [Paenibacillus sp. MER 78]
MNVLFAAAEGHPFIKTGGLADVIGALPQALRKNGVDVRVVLPKYKGIHDRYREKMEPVTVTDVYVGWRKQYCGVERLVHNGVTFYFLDNEYYFGRDGIYGYMDDGERFAFYNRAVLEVIPLLDFEPDVIHCHDWHTGMIPLIKMAHYDHLPEYQSIRTVFTIHNLLYQGIFPYEVHHDLLNLHDRYFTMEGVEYYGNLNFMKAGLVYSDHVTTVSPTYAEEIKTAHYGYGLDGLLRSLGGKLSGIVNGIDTDSYNPINDKDLAAVYSPADMKQKQKNKAALQQELGLPVRPEVPVIAMVTRLVESKGLDLVCRTLDELLYYDDVQFILLGTGEHAYEHWFYEAGLRHPEKMSAQIRFNEGLSRRFYAGSDLFLMPSMFEPCGISQLLALQYGSIPIVRETGGLNDTVQAYNEFTGEGTGFTFTNYNAHDMLYTIRRAMMFYDRKDHWQKMMSNAMSGDYSWGVSAQAYIDIYESLMKN